MMKSVVEFAAIAVAVAIYFLPSILADRRRRPDTLIIALFNACLGWTVVGWVVALLWSLTRFEARSPRAITLMKRDAQTATVMAAIVTRAQHRDRHGDRY
ncbi:superinfection immunity protein [Pararobbsia silviterrae]|uniref:Superinfection immunity protein n=1 Tax=Pararobbsia silviterrae TaxID=1792498 RepID=A0A494X1N6_9BURK|nr:superinfection immunity protein [Pararobbsia silviterrae]RKP44262.1 superinfection immunity protein [Pararobbsia silviterrae]